MRRFNLELPREPDVAGDEFQHIFFVPAAREHHRAVAMPKHEGGLHRAVAKDLHVRVARVGIRCAGRDEAVQVNPRAEPARLHRTDQTRFRARGGYVNREALNEPAKGNCVNDDAPSRFEPHRACRGCGSLQDARSESRGSAPGSTPTS